MVVATTLCAALGVAAGAAAFVLSRRGAKAGVERAAE
jgi:hypothetical protein